MRKFEFRWLTLGILMVLAGASFLWVSNDKIQRVWIASQAMLLGAMVIVTAYYAKRTSDIAKGTEKLAEVTKQAVDEARKQRQDAFLPVLVIIDAASPEEHVAIGLALMAGKIPNSLTCRMKNVGVGPALHVQYPVPWSDGVRTLTENSLIQGCEFTPPGGLAIVSSANPPYIQVTYRDVFGREYTSRKDILADFEQGTFELGPLKFCVQ